MILNYGARNFFCFKEGVEFPFELSANCPNKISKGKAVSTILCVKGANASGKTNALKILSFLKYFCTDSFAHKPDTPFLISSFFSNNEPTDLFCDFTINDDRYHYSVSLTDKEIISESLTRTKSRSTVIFTRTNNTFSHLIKEFSELKNIKLRSNASIISTAHQYELAITNPIYNFFFNILANVCYQGTIDAKLDYLAISEFYFHNPKILQFSLELIKKCDLGISSIEIRKGKKENGEIFYYPIFIQDADVKDNKLLFHDQSSGTKELFLILPSYKIVLNSGGVLAMDEFDINLHPHILPLLIGCFEDDHINRNNAQLIFTTHNSSILDYMGKYRTIIVSKEKCESYAYRLDEIPGDILRNDRSIEAAYNSGKIGGIPRLLK